MHHLLIIEPVIFFKDRESLDYDPVHILRRPVEQANIQQILLRNREMKRPEPTLVSGVIHELHPEYVGLPEDLRLTDEPALTNEG